MSKTTAPEEGKTIRVVAVQPFHEVDGVVLKVGQTYDIPTESAEAMIASGTVKKEG